MEVVRKEQLFWEVITGEDWQWELKAQDTKKLKVCASILVRTSVLVPLLC